MSQPKLKVLLIGNGGREHALAWKLAKSERVESIHVVPGNGGTLTYGPPLIQWLEGDPTKQCSKLICPGCRNAKM